MIKLPQNGIWKQTNQSDKLGSIWYTKNCNLDEAGYIKLSPRTISVYDESRNADFGIPVAIGRYGAGTYQVATTSDANFDGTISISANTWSENSGSNEPTLTANSHAVWYSGLWHASTATAVLSRPVTGGSGQAWTSRITGLTSGVRHYMAVFASRNTICVANGNVVKQYDSGYNANIDLTIPSDYEVIGLAYNSGRMLVLTRPGDTTASQNQQTRVYEWDGSTTGAQSDYALGSDAGVAICAYKSSFAVLTRSGELLYFNGGGFDKLAQFPFYVEDKILGTMLTNITNGESMIADGDVLYINIGLALNNFGKKNEVIIPNCPSGVWCFDPDFGLYHRWSGTVSKLYVTSVTDANIDTSADTFTTSGTIPATGNPVMLTSSTNAIGGINAYRTNTIYYVIKVSSTIFKLATTKANALNGTAIDITSVGSGGTNVFHMYDLYDYGVSYYENGSTGAGAISTVGETSSIYQDVIFGGNFRDTSQAVNDSLCIGIPRLENRGYFVTPKLYSNSVASNNKTLTVKFRPLDDDESIVVSYRDKEPYGVPVTSSGLTATWTSDNEFYTTQDCSEAEDYLNRGGSLEIEFLNGAGGGQCVQVTSIASSSGTYAFVLAESVLGAAASLSSEFVIMNWKKVRTITSTSNDPGYVEVGIRSSSKWNQFKIEMRGKNVTIEEVLFDDSSSR